MDRLWEAMVSNILTLIVGVITALLLDGVMKLNEWLRKPPFELKIWCVPVFGQPDVAYMYCIAKLKVLKKMKGHEWLYLYPNMFTLSPLSYSPSRGGIYCKKTQSNRLRICQLRKDDEVDLRFFVDQKNVAADPDSVSKMVDFHLSPKIRRRKPNISIDVLPG